jgi:NAD(P)H-hydrate epimerase
MKILPIEKIRDADAYTIKHEPIADIDLMERAATELYEWIMANAEPERRFMIYCGMGNNGGDGLVLARLLAQHDRQAEVILVRYSDRLSASCKTNLDRARKVRNLSVHEVATEDDIPPPKKGDIVVDALFGSGLTRPVKGFPARVVDLINDSGAIVIAVDAPSGFFCDSSNTMNEGVIIEADYTLTFQFPKLGFLFPENEKHVGHWEVLPIGLHPDFIREVEVTNHFLVHGECRDIYKPRSKFAHKGTFGHGLLIAGGYGKMGAAVLAAKAGMKAGAGLITAHIPASGNTILQTAVPAAMVSIDEDNKIFTHHPHLDSYSAVAIGPGIGTEKQTANALKLLIQEAGAPLILDADALNILGENKTWIPFIPKGSILTPHPKEFERLAGPSLNNFERNELQREFSVKHQVYVVLKGAHTCISTPEGKCFFNSTGNPGMATGGSGDVLTGILLGLKAQGYSSLEACLLGVFLHGLAGDLAAEKWGLEALTANNIAHHLGGAFKRVSHYNQ